MGSLHTSLLPGNTGQEQGTQPQLHREHRDSVRNSFSLQEWPGMVSSCLWRWCSHHAWQVASGCGRWDTAMG